LLVTEATEQLSPVTGVPKTIPVAVQPEVVVVTIFAGAVMVGSVVSTTVTTCVAVLIFPEPSVTVQVTVVFPNGKVVGASFVTEATEQLSPVTGVPSANPVTPQVADDDTVKAAGATIVGRTVSITVTVWVAVAVFPLASVTVHVTVVTPNGYEDSPLLVTEATVQLSAETGVPSTTLIAIQLLLAETITLAGADIVGSVVSTTVTN
jgi:hypothetical protein